MGRLTKNEEEKVKKAIARVIQTRSSEVIGQNDKPSPTVISKILKEDYNIDITRQTVSKYIKSGVEKYKEYVNVSEDERIKEIRAAMQVQESIWKNEKNRPLDRSKAAMAWKGLNKQRLEYEKYLKEVELKTKEIERPVYNVKLVPKTVKVKCPKCDEIYLVTDEIRVKEKEK
jgi:hypothetical protein